MYASKVNHFSAYDKLNVSKRRHRDCDVTNDSPSNQPVHNQSSANINNGPKHQQCAGSTAGVSVWHCRLQRCGKFTAMLIGTRAHWLSAAFASKLTLTLAAVLLLQCWANLRPVEAAATAVTEGISNNNDSKNIGKPSMIARLDVSCLVIIDGSEVQKELGTIWLTANNSCVIHACELSDAGIPHETITEVNCGQIYCDVDSELRPKPGSCCGECVRTHCLFNGTVHAVGQVWHSADNCTMYECAQLANIQPMINVFEKSCPTLPSDCATDKIRIKDCCAYCDRYGDDEPTGRTIEKMAEDQDIWTEEFYHRHPCVRECQFNEPPMTCRYTFAVEWYETMSKACFACPHNATDCDRPHCVLGDGMPRSVMVVNRMMPGPSLEVCLGDLVVVDVRNHLLGESTTIHWHGMHQKNYPYMDGVPHISQCPISPHSTFRYSFRAENEGTHFWHSHTGMQRGDGVFGALIVRKPRSAEPHAHLYDFDLPEHKMILQDWVHIPGVSIFASHHHSRGDNKPVNLLVNGRGRYYKAIWEQAKEANMSPSVRTQSATEAPKNQSPETSTTFLNMASSKTTPIQEMQPEMPADVDFLQPLNNITESNMRLQHENEISRLARLALLNDPPSNSSTNGTRTKRSSPEDDLEIELHKMPLQVYHVRRGFRYRFRVINAEFLNCPIQVAIDNHTLTAIHSDGYDFEAIEVGSIVTYAGERFDFVLNANQAVGNYWIRFKGLMDCSEKFTSAFQVAILRYADAPETEPPGELGYHHKATGIELNVMNRGPGYADSKTVAELVALPKYDSVSGVDRDALKPVPDYKFFVYYDFYAKDNPDFHPGNYYGFNASLGKLNKLYTPQLNHISLKFPSVALLPARAELDNSMFCNETSLAAQGIDCRRQFCNCHHVLQVPLNAVVELIIVDEGFTFDANHPFHLHGNAFRVVGLERLGDNVTIEMVKQLDRYNLLKRNLERPPVKDTVTVPDGGYTILRFEASNPGYWLFHCHIEFHAEIGMALIFKVGDNDQMQPVPKNFPTCHDYMPMTEDNGSIATNDHTASTTTTTVEADRSSSISIHQRSRLLAQLTLWLTVVASMLRLFR